jgi:hypothetical protein
MKLLIMKFSCDTDRKCVFVELFWFFRGMLYNCLGLRYAIPFDRLVTAGFKFSTLLMAEAFQICNTFQGIRDLTVYAGGTLLVAQWLRYCATNRKVAESIPDGVIVIFH